MYSVFNFCQYVIIKGRQRITQKGLKRLCSRQEEERNNLYIMNMYIRDILTILVFLLDHWNKGMNQIDILEKDKKDLYCENIGTKKIQIFKQ